MDVRVRALLAMSAVALAGGLGLGLILAPASPDPAAAPSDRATTSARPARPSGALRPPTPLRAEFAHFCDYDVDWPLFVTTVHLTNTGSLDLVVRVPAFWTMNASTGLDRERIIPLPAHTKRQITFAVRVDEATKPVRDVCRVTVDIVRAG